MWLHATVCTSRVDDDAPELLAIGKKRLRRKIAGAMLLAAAVLWVGKLLCHLQVFSERTGYNMSCVAMSSQLANTKFITSENGQ